MRVLARDGTVHELKESEILYFSIHKSEISVHTAHAEYILPTNFEQLQQAYAELNFDRVDRSYIVNMNKVQGYHAERQSVFFSDGTFAPVSERHQKKIIQYLNENKKRD